MTKKSMIMIVVLVAVGILFVSGCSRQSTQDSCNKDDECIIRFSHCSCGYICDYEREMYADCAMMCPQDSQEGLAALPPGPEPKCVCRAHQCVRNLD